MRQKWTETDIKTLIELYPNMQTSEIAKRLNHSIKSIYSQASILKLKKTKELIAKTSRERTEHPDHPSRMYRFPKGNISHNKGKKQSEYMSQAGINNTLGTRFKKGHIPHNHKPVGHERINIDGYIEIKTDEPNVFKLKHRIEWEKHKGAIPKGYNIQFKDSNRKNCDISNLYMISRKEQMKDNTIQRYPPELRQTIKTISKLQKTIKNETNKS